MVLLTESYVHPYPGPCRKPDELRIDSMVSKGGSEFVLFLFTGYFLTYGSSQLEVGKTSGEAQPQLDALSYDTEAKLRNYCDLSQWRILFRKQISEPNGKVKYERVHPEAHHSCAGLLSEERAAPGPEHSDCGFWKRKCFLHLRRWQTQQDDKPKPSKRTRKQNYSSHGISMSLIKLCTVLTTTISLALYSLWFRDGPGV